MGLSGEDEEGAHGWLVTLQIGSDGVGREECIAEVSWIWGGFLLTFSAACPDYLPGFWVEAFCFEEEVLIC